MLTVIREHNEELVALCRKHRVQRLSLFGSAVTGKYRAGSSDLDFLVTFDSLTSHDNLWNFMALAEDLEHLFGTHVDLLEDRTFRNPYFNTEVSRSRTVVYEATHEKVPV